MRFIKYISDLHIERKFKPIIFNKKQLGGNLFIAGDIGSPLEDSYWNFLKYASNNFDNIYFTTGNHEYWNKKNYTINDINDIINDKSINYNNLHFLNDSMVSTNDYDIIGSTLWSCPLYNLRYSIDFHMIYYSNNEKLTPKTMRKLHNRSMNEINKMIKQNEKPKIILTHYLPSYQFTKKKPYFAPVYSIFASDLNHMIKPPIVAWIFGHTHDRFIRNVNGVKCCVNALGYKKKVNIDEFHI
jgi:predicted phosphohydrolase